MLACLTPLLLAQPALALEVVGTSVRLSWTAASGPVAGYDVEVSRGGGAFVVERQVAMSAVELSGALGETLAVRVSAFDAGGRRGPVSPLSDPVSFVSPPAGTGASASGDLDGNGLTDAVAVDLASGALNAVLLAADGSRRWVTLGAPRDPTLRPVGVADVDGDGRADVLWRSRTTGASELWRLRGLSYSSLALPAQAPRFELVAFRDFSGDRRADVLWHDPATGESQLWILGAGGYEKTLAVDPAPVGARLAAVCDADGDRLPDLLWLNVQTRALDAWLMRGAVPHAVLSLGVAAASSTVVGVGDLDGNGIEDLVWRRATSRGDALDVWFLAAGSAPRSGVAAKLARGSRLRGVVDLDSNGSDDLVLGSSSSLSGLAVLPVRVRGSSKRWQTRTLSIGGASPADWQFLSLD